MNTQHSDVLAHAPATKHWSLSIDDDALVTLHFNVADSSTNVLSAEVLTEFEQQLEYIETKSVNGMMIVSDKSSGFIAGADIKEFTCIQNEQEALQLIQRGQKLFDRLEALSIPTISVINGFCVGGGLELALACDYRIALDQAKTRIGLPEVKLGIHPGFGGSMRLNRLIGAMSAMSLMLAGRTVDTRQAKRLGIIDHAVPQRQLISAAVAMLKTKPKPHRASFFKALQSRSLVRPVLAWLFRRQLAKQASKDHYPAPYALIDVWQLYAGNERAMLDAEARSAAQLIMTDTSKNLVRVFMLQERLKSFGKQQQSKPTTVKHVHVVGAGTMGGDIASWSALRNLSVTLQDREAKFIAPAFKRASQLFKRKLKPARLANAAMDRLRPDLQGIGINQADVIIEAIVENAEIKQDLFKSLESQCQPNAILATNTSSIPLETLSQVLQNPERLVGIHFFNPVAMMQLVEVVSAPNTSPQVVSAAAAFVRQIDRLPLPVKSAPGFLINRILMPYLLEAVELLSEGVPAEEIDRVATDFGMPMGPIRLADKVGLDICLSVANILADQLNMQVPAILKHKVDNNHLGKKTGQGFYEYKPSKFKWLQWKQAQQPAEQKPHADIEDRLILRMLNECIACLRENVVEDADLLDAGMIFATGFAPFTGGPMHYLNTRGRDSVLQCLTELESRYGERFRPDPGWNQPLL